MKKLIVEASPLLGRVSGIGHNILELIKAIHNSPKAQEIELILAVPFDKKKELKKILPGDFKIRGIPLPIAVYYLLGKINLVPPLDLMLGKGIYLFPNYKNSPLLFSKSFTYIYDVSFILYPEFVHPKNKKYILSNISKWVKRTDRILTISRSAKEDIAYHLKVPKSKISIVPCGVDMNFFRPASLQKISAIKRKYQISGDYLLYVGNIEPRKNLIKLIRAFRKVYDKYPSLKLVLIGGDGWQNGSIMEEISRAITEGYPIVKPTQYVPDEDLPPLYSGALMLVHPALYEGFGISPLQAMACGTPVIVADNSSMPEVVGDAGLYVHANSIEDIAEKILMYYENQETRNLHISEGFIQAKKFQWDNSADSLINAIKYKVD